MYTQAGSEFVALCRSQVAVLTQALGAALSAVYLTQELVEEATPKLIPVVVYPDAATVSQQNNADLVLPQQMSKIKPTPRLSTATLRLLPMPSEYGQQVGEASPDWQENSLWQQRQIVLPLIHEGVVMGVLVTSREDRPWNDREKATIELIAKTLSVAYVMDQRRVWFEQQLTQQEIYQEKQRDLIDDLLHQARSPLTALRTLGKLLIKRLRPGDKNQEVAASIVRESDRLQELLQQLNNYLEINPASLAPLTLPATSVLQGQQSETRDDGQGITLTTNLPLEVTRKGLHLPPAQALTLESFSVATVLKPLLVAAEAIATERHLEFCSYIPDDLPAVIGNQKNLHEVLSNIIDNAIKYTPAGGQIEIQVGVAQLDSRGTSAQLSEYELAKVAPQKNLQHIAITISDTGPGIPPQDLEHLFERHYRGVQASTEIPGSGLGLAIAKELIEQMHGQIEAFSPAQSIWTEYRTQSAIDKARDYRARGTTFVVWLLTK
ncbi:MAG: sensor histidine kinase [Symploca sp. SIO1C4]|uniref:histidine kinase n=1 Tax=Symploca sp. SIO1C4 TaxID=2607765 RepID=A0A6B3N9E5_9CYAN|nr:sensor histidine kinase [Symploca sp. SIO1C4]